MLPVCLVMIAAIAAASAEPAIAASEELDIITVEASKMPVATHELTNRVTLIDSERIEREVAQNIDDLVRYEPGVDVVDQGSRFGLSGISIRGIGGNRVKIEVDGVPTADAFSIGSFSNASRDFVDVDSLKQVEIIRGPSSAMFGSDALGGVVSFVTRGPRDLLGDKDRYFDTTVGFNSVDDSALISGTAAFAFDDFAAMLRANARQGEESSAGLRDPLDDDSLNVLAKVDFGDASQGAFTLALESFRADSKTAVNSLEGVQDFTGAFGFPYIVDTTTVSADDRRERQRISIGQEWLDGVFGTDYLRWRGYYQDSTTTQDTFEARDTLIAGVPGSVERDRRFEFDQSLYGIEVNAGSLFETGSLEHQLAYGLEYEEADTKQIRLGTETDLLTSETSNQVGPDLFPVRDFPVSETRRTGVYLQDHITLGSFSIVPGVRWDRYELAPEVDTIFSDANPGIESVAISDDQFSPKLGLLWSVTDSTQLYAQYTEGFRAPPVNDVNVGFTNLVFGYTTLPNPDLKSESSQGYEAGVRFASPTTQWDFALFTTRYDDFIQSFQVVGFDPVQQLLLFQSVNVDEVEIQGAEFSGSFAPAVLPEGWRLRASVAYAEGENLETGLPINSVAPLNGVLGVDFVSSDSRWGGSLLARAAASQDDLDETEGELLSPDGYAVFDLLGFWRPTDNSRFRVGAYNLTDEAYTAYLDVQGVPADTTNPDRFQRPGREYSVALDISFD